MKECVFTSSFFLFCFSKKSIFYVGGGGSCGVLTARLLERNATHKSLEWKNTRGLGTKIV